MHISNNENNAAGIYDVYNEITHEYKNNYC